MNEKRNISLDIYDLTRKEKLCSLFDSYAEMSGQAYDIIIKTERNGWKELSFTLPYKMETAEGNVDNYRIDYLIADYLIRTTETHGDKIEYDWFLISEPKVTHNAFTKTVSVTAGHVAQLLKTKNLALEFSDKEGNNVGTAKELLTTILDGTGWKPGDVKEFYEDYDPTLIKYRSLKASSKTGAFKLITSMCSLFDAKPVYHGDTKTVDIIPMNPFSKPADGSMPDVVNDDVVELHFGRNVSNVTRTLNTENLVTKLYAYGSWNNTDVGYCGIDTSEHRLYKFITADDIVAGKQYWFTYTDEAELSVFRNFTSTADIPAGTELYLSMLDSASLGYVYYINAEEPYKEFMRDVFGLDVEYDGEDMALDSAVPDGIKMKYVSAIEIESGNIGTQLNFSDVSYTKEKNWFPFLFNFDYYRSVDLFKNSHLQMLANYQVNAPILYEKVYEASTNYSRKNLELSNTIGVVDFVKLNVKQVNNKDNYVELDLNTTENKKGIYYTTEIDKKPELYFNWVLCDGLDTLGDPVNSGASVLYVVRHDTDPFSWHKIFLRDKGYKESEEEVDPVPVDDREDYPNWITLEAAYDEYSNYLSPSSDDCEYFLFKSDSLNGKLGASESTAQAIEQTIEKNTKKMTVKHPVYFMLDGTKEPSVAEKQGEINGHAWLWKYAYEYGAPSTMKFCYYPRKENGEPEDGADLSWHNVFISPVAPELSESILGDWWFDDKKRTTKYARKNPETGELEWFADNTYIYTQEIAAVFGTVYQQCLYMDETYKGKYTYIEYAVKDELQPSNYYYDTGFGKYYMFTTKETLEKGDKLVIRNDKKYMLQYRDGIESTVEYESVWYDSCGVPEEQIFSCNNFESGGINLENGTTYDDPSKCRSLTKVLRGSMSAQGRWMISVPYKDTEKEDPKVPGVTVKEPYSFDLVFYDELDEFVKSMSFKDPVSFDYFEGLPYVSFDVTDNVSYIKIVFNDKKDILNNKTIIVKPNNKTDVIYSSDEAYNNILGWDIPETYEDLDPLTREKIEKKNELIGLVSYIDQMSQYADETYEVYYKRKVEAQDIQKRMDVALAEAFGEMYREGYWQKDDYVEGDEHKLYTDAIDNLKEISKPETKYNITYLDLYSSNDFDYGVTQDTSKVLWPDVSIMNAIHLVDQEIGVNCWAFIDTIQKCYDNPWKTKITINTNLKTMNQHSFTDVMTAIANVASEVKAKVTIYDRAKFINEDGTLASSKSSGDGKTLYENSTAAELSSIGLKLASGKGSTGSWNWTTIITGDSIETPMLKTAKILCTQNGSYFITRAEADALYASRA